MYQHTERKERERKGFSKRDSQFKTLALQLEEDSKEKNIAKNTKDNVLYVMCANHNLEQCKEYLTKSVDERSKYLSTKKLCYGCLKPISKTLTTRKCNQRRTWKVCNENILRHCIDLIWKRKPSKELSIIHLIKVTRHKMEFWKATL